MNPPRECEDATVFFERMAQIDRQVSEILNATHEKRLLGMKPKKCANLEFVVGQKVWYRRPPNSGHKLDSRWLGPAVIKERQGSHSYILEIKPGVEMGVHDSFLKPFQEDSLTGKPIPLFYHQRTEPDLEAGIDEWEVDKIVDHKVDKKGNLLFLTHWKGFPSSENTWEPVGNFIHRYSSDFVNYCTRNNLAIDITKFLSGEPTE
jgi:hypothetical protein